MLMMKNQSCANLLQRRGNTRNEKTEILVTSRPQKPLNMSLAIMKDRVTIIVLVYIMMAIMVASAKSIVLVLLIAKVDSLDVIVRVAVQLTLALVLKLIENVIQICVVIVEPAYIPCIFLLSKST
jgi:hypothetical protein